ncbi:MAG TPA: SDR family oxidoreductase, partial [Vulgatibacter sp.]
MANVHFLTGYPGFLGSRLLARLLEVDRKSRVSVLVQGRFAKDARKALHALPAARASRVRILLGDVADMHLGLSGEEYRRLAAEVTHIHHLAAISRLDSDRQALERVNVGGTRNVLELGRDSPNLVRLGYVSTVQVAGDRQGVVDEDELAEGQRFRNGYEETKFRAEILAR